MGNKNSLSAFIRALDTVLGDDVVNDHVITYVDELRDESGKLRGEFNKKQLRMYQETGD
jgi:hypothetical protein